jgi:hypothetical protein
MRLKGACRTLVATFVAGALAVPPGLFAQATSTAGAPVGSPTPAAGSDIGWPRRYDLSDGAATLHQPQIASWEGQKRMVAWSAVAYEAKGAKQPTLGTLRFEATTSVSLEERLVSFADFRISEINFPTLERSATQRLSADLHSAIPIHDRIIDLDRVLTAVDKSTILVRETPGVKADPPTVYFSARPAVLVNLDGEPVWSPITGVDLKFAVNTNWDLFNHEPTRTMYLRSEATWLKAPALEGAWQPAGKLPESFQKLPADTNWQDVRANLPGKAIAAAAVPTVIVSTQPAELLLLRGAPTYRAVTGTDLLWVSNTDSDLFRLGKTGAFYYLVAGRWFSASELSGPWTFATPTLPDDFKRIPVEHERSRVLASVPGTSQATEAILLAGIPQTARVNVKEMQPPDVQYQGEPNFQSIDTTSLSRATNTDKDVIKVGDLYYMCFQAVWFMSRNPAGPWEVARSVPTEIYGIPASSPSHHVTYVVVEEDDNDNDEWVTFGYVAAYTGMMVAWGCAVWGTGWYYPPYIGYGGAFPIYYGYPRTYGFSAWYNPWTGAYGRGTGVYGPYGGAGMGAVYNPRTGTYARGATAYGPYGSRTVAQAWNPRTGTYAGTRQGSNIYGNWGTSYVQRGDDWARTSHRTNYATGATTRTIRTDDGAAATRRGATGRTTVGRSDSGDIYAGHNGNVYRKGNDGSWQHWNDGGWSSSTRPAGTTAGQLDHDSRARAEGAERTRDSSTYRSAPTRERGGSYRGSRAGGGRRR